jgi:hypothetical protein
MTPTLWCMSVAAIVLCGTASEASVSLEDRIAAFRRFASDDYGACTVQFTHKHALSSAAKAIFEQHAEEQGSRLSWGTDDRGDVYYSVVRGPGGLHIRRSSDPGDFLSFGFKPDHLALGWSSNVLWTVLGSTVLLDYDVGRNCTTPLDVLLLEPGGQQLFIQDLPRRVLRLGLPMSAGQIVWQGDSFRTEEVARGGRTMQGRLRLLDGVPGRVEWAVVDDHGNVVREGLSELGYGAPDHLMPSEIRIRENPTAGRPQPEVDIRVTDLRVDTSPEQLGADRFSPIPYILANQDTVVVNAISNHLAMIVFQNGAWQTEPVVGFRTDGRALGTGRNVVAVVFFLFLVSSLCLLLWVFRRSAKVE